MKTGVIVTTFNRPACLARSLPQIVAAAKEVGAPVLVVDDASDEIERRGWPLFHAAYLPNPEADITLIELPRNRGLAGALNIGLSYFLADPSIESICYFQDDVEVDPLCIAACAEMLKVYPHSLLTGHDAKEHEDKYVWEGNKKFLTRSEEKGIVGKSKVACRATHMMATRKAWMDVLPIPSRGLGLPSKVVRDRNYPERRGTGSGVDWWIVRDSPNRLPVLCVPGLVRSFAWKREDSCWDNEQVAGEDAPISRDAIKEWIDARR